MARLTSDRRWFAAMLSLGVLGGAFALLTRSPEPHRSAALTSAGPDGPSPQAEGAPPAFIVTAEEQGIAVRSSADGRVLRVLADDAGARQAFGVAVSPDGKDVLFVVRRERACPGAPVAPGRVMRVPVGGGDAQEMMLGVSPVYSPDARRFAVITDAQRHIETKDPTCAKQAVMYENEGSSWSAIGLRDGMAGHYLRATPMSWSPDGSGFIAEGLDPEDDDRLFFVRGMRELGPGTATLGDPVSALPTTIMAPAAFIDDQTIAAPATIARERWIAAYDKDTGAIERPLFRLSAEPSVVRSDGTGRHVLVASTRDDDHLIQRWDASTNLLTTITDVAVRDVAWPAGPTSPPGRIVAVTRSGHIQIRRTSDGSVVRDLADGVETTTGGHIAYASSVGAVFVDGFGVSGCGVARVDLKTGTLTEVVSAKRPEVTPDGQSLLFVYAGGDGCADGEAIVIRDLNSDDERSWPLGSGGEDWSVVSGHPYTDDSFLFELDDPDGNRSVRELTSSFGSFSTPPPDTLLPAQEQQLTESAELGGFTSMDELLLVDRGSLSTAGRSFNGTRPVTSIDQAVDNERIDVDESRQHLLFVAEDGPLYRFSACAARPVLVADDVVAAAWLS